MYDWSFPLIIEFPQEILVLLNRLKLHLFLLLLGKLLVENLGRRYSGLLKQHLWFEPAISDLELALDLFPHEVKLVDRLAELDAYRLVVILAELFALIFAEVKAIE